MIHGPVFRSKAEALSGIQIGRFNSQFNKYQLRLSKKRGKTQRKMKKSTAVLKGKMQRLGNSSTKLFSGKNPGRMTENEVSEIIIRCATRVHKVLGPGLSKSAYEECMGYALSKTVLEIERRKTLQLSGEEVKPDGGYRLDFVANNKVILEIKTMDGRDDIHLAKIHDCLRLSGCKSGLLIDFNADQITNGIKRVANNNYRCRSLSVAPNPIS